MTSQQKDILVFADQRTRGLRQHAEEEQKSTVTRLQKGINSLSLRGEKISADTIKYETGLSYKTISRNPLALRLFRENSTHLKQKRNGFGRVVPNSTKKPARENKNLDTFDKYSKDKLKKMLKDEKLKREKIEIHWKQMVEENIQMQLKIIQLEAKPNS